MFVSIEEFCKNHQFTLTALSSFATLAAVIVSLYMAHWSIRPRINAYVSFRKILFSGADIKSAPKYLTAYISNMSHVPIHIPFSFFSWKFPFSSYEYRVLPLDYYGVDGLVPKHDYPFKIESNSSEIFYLCDYGSCLQEMKKSVSDLKWFVKLRCFFVKVKIGTNDGRDHYASISHEVRKELFFK